MNLPQSITGKGITYTYDAAGQKLRKVVGTSTIDYIDRIQYNGPDIEFIQTEEGRAMANGATDYNYEYSLTDHLGNSRVNFDTYGQPIAHKVQADDYMPFGMKISRGANGLKNNYLYNNKEFQDNLGLYDYGARFYDPLVTRWLIADPLVEADQETMITYAYVLNSPIRLIDPDVRAPTYGGEKIPKNEKNN